MQVRVQPTQARPQRKHHITPHGWADRSARSWLRRHRIPRRNRPGTITERFPTAAARHGSLSAVGISGYRAGNHTHRAAHRPTDGTHPEPDARTRDTLFAPRASHPGWSANDNRAEPKTSAQSAQRKRSFGVGDIVLPQPEVLNGRADRDHHMRLAGPPR